MRCEELIPQAEPERMINSLQLGKLPELEAKFFGAFKQNLIPSLKGAFAEIPGKAVMELPHYSHTEEKSKGRNY